MNNEISTAFMEEMLETWPKLHVIAFDSDKVLGKHAKTGKAYYIYNIDDDMGFTFHLLSECNEEYVKWVKDLIDSLNISVSTMETDTDYYEQLY